MGFLRESFRITRCLKAFAALVTMTVVAAAQTSRIGATLEGIVSDSSGGRIPSAEVRLREIDTHRSRAIVTDERGFFRTSELPVGVYEVFVECPGFAPYHHTGVTLQVGDTVRLNVVLQPAGIASEVTVQNAGALGIPNPAPQQINRPVFGPERQLPQFGNVYQLENSAGSTHHGLTLSLSRRMADELEFSASYTLSKALNDASDFDEQPQDPFDLRAERALSRQHQPQRCVFSALWDLPIGEEEKGIGGVSSSTLLERVFAHIEVAPILTVASGRPQNPLTGLDWNRSQTIPLSARPRGFGRNSLMGPGQATLDLRVLKYIPFGSPSRRLDLVAEFFNLFNHSNVSQINSIFGMGSLPVAGFRQPVAGAGARQIQFSLDFEF